MIQYTTIWRGQIIMACANHTGYVERRGKYRFLAWKKYWCVLSESLLLFYKDEGTYKSLGQFVDIFDLHSTVTVKADETKKTIKIASISSDISLRLKDEHSFLAWTAALENVIASRSEVPDLPEKSRNSYMSVGESVTSYTRSSTSGYNTEIDFSRTGSTEETLLQDCTEQTLSDAKMQPQPNWRAVTDELKFKQRKNLPTNDIELVSITNLKVHELKNETTDYVSHESSNREVEREAINLPVHNQNVKGQSESMSSHAGPHEDGLDKSPSEAEEKIQSAPSKKNRFPAFRKNRKKTQTFQSYDLDVSSKPVSRRSSFLIFSPRPKSEIESETPDPCKQPGNAQPDAIKGRTEKKSTRRSKNRSRTQSEIPAGKTLSNDTPNQSEDDGGPRKPKKGFFRNLLRGTRSSPGRKGIKKTSETADQTEGVVPDSTSMRGASDERTDPQSIAAEVRPTSGLGTRRQSKRRSKRASRRRIPRIRMYTSSESQSERGVSPLPVSLVPRSPTTEPNDYSLFEMLKHLQQEDSAEDLDHPQKEDAGTEKKEHVQPDILITSTEVSYHSTFLLAHKCLTQATNEGCCSAQPSKEPSPTYSPDITQETSPPALPARTGNAMTPTHRQPNDPLDTPPLPPRSPKMSSQKIHHREAYDKLPSKEKSQIAPVLPPKIAKGWITGPCTTSAEVSPALPPKMKKNSPNGSKDSCYDTVRLLTVTDRSTSKVSLKQPATEREGRVRRLRERKNSVVTHTPASAKLDILPSLQCQLLEPPQRCQRHNIQTSPALPPKMRRNTASGRPPSTYYDAVPTPKTTGSSQPSSPLLTPRRLHLAADYVAPTSCLHDLSVSTSLEILPHSQKGQTSDSQGHPDDEIPPPLPPKTRTRCISFTHDRPRDYESSVSEGSDDSLKRTTQPSFFKSLFENDNLPEITQDIVCRLGLPGCKRPLKKTTPIDDPDDPNYNQI